MAREFKFSASSKARLDACHLDLQLVFYRVVKKFDCKIHEGARGETKQNKYFEAGTSRVRYPDSKHNTRPSEAVHVIPHPFPGWKNTVAFYFFAGYVIATAEGRASCSPGLPNRLGARRCMMSLMMSETWRPGERCPEVS